MARKRELPYAPNDVIDGKYRVIRHVGSGGMGIVYEVEDISIERRYVLKALHPEYADNKAIVKRMIEEAKALGKLHHRNIVEVFTAGVTSDKYKLAYYVMEKLLGHTLHAVLAKKGSLPLNHVYGIVSDLFDALEYAHSKGFVHRDVKPENLFIHNDPRGGPPVTKLLDFGIMTLMAGDTRNTGHGFVGTLRYAPPEQLRGEKVTARSDLYAATLVLYEMVAGRGPFDDEGGEIAVVGAHLHKAAPLLSTWLPVPQELDMLVSAGLEKAPERRPSDAHTMREVLLRLKKALRKQQQQSDAPPDSFKDVVGDVGEPSISNIEDIEKAESSGSLRAAPPKPGTLQGVASGSVSPAASSVPSSRGSTQTGESPAFASRPVEDDVVPPPAPPPPEPPPPEPAPSSLAPVSVHRSVMVGEELAAPAHAPAWLPAWEPPSIPPPQPAPPPQASYSHTQAASPPAPEAATPHVGGVAASEPTRFALAPNAPTNRVTARLHVPPFGNGFAPPPEAGAPPNAANLATNFPSQRPGSSPDAIPFPVRSQDPHAASHQPDKTVEDRPEVIAAMLGIAPSSEGAPSTTTASVTRSVAHDDVSDSRRPRKPLALTLAVGAAVASLAVLGVVAAMKLARDDTATTTAAPAVTSASNAIPLVNETAVPTAVPAPAHPSLTAPPTPGAPSSLPPENATATTPPRPPPTAVAATALVARPASSPPRAPIEDVSRSKQVPSATTSSAAPRPIGRDLLQGAEPGPTRPGPGF